MNNSIQTDFTQHNIGIDLFRALTMFVMIFVNDFWKIHDVPHWLEHAVWGEDFMGLADVVFPCFLFVVGMSIPFAIESRYKRDLSGESTIGHILSRTLALLIMGVFITNSEVRLSPEVNYKIGVYWIMMIIASICIWNQYPQTNNKEKKLFYAFLKLVGILMLFYLAVTFRDPQGAFFVARWGILGSIGWTYLLCALIYVYTRDRLKKLIPCWIVFVLICLLGARMNESSGGASLLNFPRPNFYNEVLDILHIGNGALPAFTIGGVIFSVLSTRYAYLEGRKKLLYISILAGSLFIAGIWARQYWILSKLSATPTWVFYVTAIAIVCYGLLNWLAQIGKASWFNIIKPAGTATLTCYLMPYISYGLADLTGIILPDWLTHGFIGLINCLCFALIIIGTTWLLGHFYIKLKI